MPPCANANSYVGTRRSGFKSGLSSGSEHRFIRLALLLRGRADDRRREALAVGRDRPVLSHGHLDPGMHVLTKPFAMEALASRIKSLIAGA